MAVAGNHGSLRPLDRMVGLGQETVGKSTNSHAGQKAVKAPSSAPKSDFAAQLAEPSNPSPMPPVQTKRETGKPALKNSRGNEQKREPPKDLGRETASKGDQPTKISNKIPIKNKEPKGESLPPSERSSLALKDETTPPKESIQNEAGAETTQEASPRNLKTEIKGLPVVALLTGRLEGLKPQDITQLVAENGFVKSALTESDMVGFFEKPVEIESLLRDLGVSEDILEGLRLNGVDLSTMGTPVGLFKSVGIDALQVRSELTILRDNLSLGTIGDYLKRAQVLSKGGPSPGLLYGEGGLGGPMGQMGAYGGGRLEAGPSGQPLGNSPQQTGVVRPASSPDAESLPITEDQSQKFMEASPNRTSPQGMESLTSSGVGQVPSTPKANPQLGSKAAGRNDLGNNKISSKALAPSDNGLGMAGRPSGASRTSLFQGLDIPFAEESGSRVAGLLEPGVSPWEGQTLSNGFELESLTPGFIGSEVLLGDQIPKDPFNQSSLPTMGTSLQPQAQTASFDHWYAMGQKMSPQEQVFGLGVSGQEIAVPKNAIPREELVLQKIGLSDQGLIQTEEPKQPMNVGIQAGGLAAALQRLAPEVDISASPNQQSHDLLRTPSTEKGASQVVRGPRDFMESWTQARQAMGQPQGLDPLQNKQKNPSLQPSSLSFSGTTANGVSLQQLGLAEPSIHRGELRTTLPDSTERELTSHLETLQGSTDLGFDPEGRSGIGDRGDSRAMGIIAGGRPEDQNQQDQSGLGQGEGFRNSMTSQERAQWVQKVFDGAHMLLTQGGGQMRLSMPQTPWGTLDVALNMTNQKMDIRVLAGDEGIREALAAELGQLGDLLNARNIELGKVEVGLSRVASQTGSQQSSQQGSQQSGGEQKYKDHGIHQDWLQDMRSQVKLAQFDQLRSLASPRSYQKDAENYGSALQNTIHKII